MNILCWELKKIFKNPKVRIQFLTITLLIEFIAYGFTWDPFLFRIFKEGSFYGLDPKEFINGNLFCRLSTIIILNSIIPIFICLTTVGQFAGEESDGVLKSIIAASSSRSKIFLSKALSSFLYSVIMILFSFLLSYLVGLIAFGHGELIAGNNYIGHILKGLRTIPEKDIIVREIFALLLAPIALFPLLTLSILTSVATSKPLTALTMVLAVYFGTSSVGSLPFNTFQRFNYNFFVAYMNFWGDVFFEKIPWQDIAYMGSFVLAYSLTFLVIAWGLFLKKDFKI